MNALKAIDISGQAPTFFFFNKRKSSTVFGGIISIIIFLVTCICIFLLGGDFIQRRNPKVLTSIERTDNLTIVNLSSQVFPIYFRLEDREGFPVNFTNKFYPFIVYWEYQRTANDTLQQTQYKISHLDKCRLDNHLNINDDPSKYYCMNWNNEAMGGYTESDYFGFFSFFLSFCPQGFYDKEACTSTEDIDEIINRENMWYISFYYPVYQVHPNNYDHPLKITYKNYIRQLSRRLIKVDKFVFQNVVMRDDKGIMMNVYNNLTDIALFEKSYEYYYNSNDETVLKKESPAYIYQANFYFSSEYNYITRSYLKLQDIIATIGGIIKCIMIVLNLLSVHFNQSKIFDNIIMNLFDFIKPKDNDSNNNNTCGKMNKLPSEMPNEPLHRQLNNCFMQPKLGIHSFNFDMDSQENKKDIGLDKSNMKINQNKTTINQPYMTIITKEKTGKRKKAKGNNTYPSSTFRLLFHSFSSFIRKDAIYSYYAFAYMQVKQRLDIAYYFKQQFNLQFMQKILLREYQMIAINNFKKPNIYKKQELGDIFGLFTKEEEKDYYERCIPIIKTMNGIQSPDYFLFDYYKGNES